MTPRRRPRTSRAVRTCLLGLLLLAPAQPGAAEPAIAEGWEGGGSGWNLDGSGVRVDCTRGKPGCSLLMDPPDGGRAYATLDVRHALDRPTTVSYDFLGHETEGDTDMLFILSLSGGGRIVVTETDWWSPNNRISVSSEGLGEDRDFHRFTAGAWTRLAILLDPAADTVEVEVRNASGEVVALSRTLPIPPLADAITRIQYYAVAWSAFTNAMSFDNLEVAPTTLRRSFIEDFERGLDAWTVEGDATTIDCGRGKPGCSLRQAPAAGERTTATMRVGGPMKGVTSLRYDFLADSTSSDTDMLTVLTLAGGHRVVLTETESGTGVSIASEGVDEDRAFSNWPVARLWYTVVVVLDPENDTVRAELRLENVVVARSRALAIPADSNAVESIAFASVSWSRHASGMNFDNVRLAPGYPLPVPVRPGVVGLPDRNPPPYLRSTD